MMLRVATLVAFVAVTNAELFEWLPNADFSTEQNWDFGNLTSFAEENLGVVDLNVDCMNSWGDEGGQARIDSSLVVTEISLPTNGEIFYSEGTSITFKPAAEPPNTMTWKCQVRDTMCSQNYQVIQNSVVDGQIVSEYVTPDSPPCYEDIIQFDSQAAHAISWGPHQHILEVHIVGHENIDNDKQYESRSSDWNAYWRNSAGFMQGFMPIIGNCKDNEVCKNQCVDSCPVDKVHNPADPTEFFQQLEKQAADKTYEQSLFQHALDSLNGASSTKMAQGLADVQADWTEQLADAGRGNVATVSMDVTVDSTHMTSWLAAANYKAGRSSLFSATDLNTISFVLTKETAEKSIAWFTSLTLAQKTRVWYTVGEPMDETENLRVADIMTFFMGDGLVTFGLKGVFQTANDDLSLNLNIAATSATTVSGGAVDGGTFDTSPGAYTFSNIDITGTTMKNTTDLYIAPEVMSMMFSSVTTKFALAYRIYTLEAEIIAVTAKIAAKTVSPSMSPSVSPSTAPTITPSMSPSVSPTITLSSSPSVSPTVVEAASFLASESGFMVLAGGGGGALLIIILIVVIVCLLSKKNSGDKARVDQRAVEAFANPLYDGSVQGGVMPQKTTDTKEQEQAQSESLYDEPAVNEKHNPMFQSQDEGVDNASSSGDYLDVEPDEDDEDEDTDDDE